MGHNEPIRKTRTRHGPPVSEIPDKLYFRIGEVARLCEVPAYVLRFWESEFPQLKPNKGGTGQRLYRRRDVEMALRVKSLLKEEGYTIPGARARAQGRVQAEGAATLPARGRRAVSPTSSNCAACAANSRPSPPCSRAPSTTFPARPKSAPHKPRTPSAARVARPHQPARPQPPRSPSTKARPSVQASVWSFRSPLFVIPQRSGGIWLDSKSKCNILIWRRMLHGENVYAVVFGGSQSYPGAVIHGLEAGGDRRRPQRARSTVTREMSRNGWRPAAVVSPQSRRWGNGGYLARTANLRAQRLQRKPRVPRRLVPGTTLWQAVIEHLRRGLSPAQIASTLARMPDPVRLSHETIYTAFYAMPRGQLRARVLALLRRAHPTRGSRSPARHQRPFLDAMTLIDHRPAEVAERIVPGHWEGDLIKGTMNRSRVGTLVERTTLFVALVKLEDGRAETTANGFANILKRFDSQLRRSLTYDQGREMAQHKSLGEQAGLKVYFAHPHSPWERGICENTNGLLRQYLPKGRDLSVFSQDQLDDIAMLMNARPRKTLGWKAPAELFLPQGAFDFVKHWSTTIKPVALGA